MQQEDLQASFANIPGSTARMARGFRRALEELADRQAVTAGFTPELMDQQLQAVVSDYHQNAQGIINGVAQHVREAERVGQPVPEPPDLSGALAILKVRSLADAEKLVATFES